MIRKLTSFLRTFQSRRRGPTPRSLPPGPGRVLVAYDDQDVRRGLVSLLHRMGGLVCQGVGGGPREMERAAARLEADLVLLDARRLDSRSRKLVRRLKRRRPGIRVFLLGLDDGPGYQRWARRAGADGYLSTARVAESLDKILSRS